MGAARATALGSSHAEARPTSRRRRDPGIGVPALCERPRRRRPARRHQRFRVRVVPRRLHADPRRPAAREPRRGRDGGRGVPEHRPEPRHHPRHPGLLRRRLPRHDHHRQSPTTTAFPSRTTCRTTAASRSCRSATATCSCTATTTYVIHYTQVDTIRYFPDTDDDEFFWDVNGTGWEQPFDEVSATVTLGPELADAIGARALAATRAPKGATTPCSEGIAITEPLVIDAGARDLEPGENLTIVIPFLPHTFVEGEPGRPGRPDRLRAAASGLGRGALAVRLAVVRGRDRRRRRAAPQARGRDEHDHPAVLGAEGPGCDGRRRADRAAAHGTPGADS